jgi:hypothetical protein
LRFGINTFTSGLLDRGSNTAIEGAVSDLLTAIQKRWPNWRKRPV